MPGLDPALFGPGSAYGVSHVDGSMPWYQIDADPAWVRVTPKDQVAVYYNRQRQQWALFQGGKLPALLTHDTPTKLPVIEPNGSVISDLKGNPVTYIFLAFVAAAGAGALGASEAAAAGTGAATGATAATTTGAEAATAGAAGAGAATAAASESTAAAEAGVASSVAETTTTLADTVKGITGSIKEFVAGIKETIGPLVSGIGDTLHEITGTVREITDGLIKPITQPILEAMNTFKALRQILERDLSAGITGILRIPTDISNALGSLDAVVQRSITMLGTAQAATTANILVPALKGADGRTLGDLNTTFESVLAPAVGTFTPSPRITLEEPPNLEAFKAWAQEQQDQLYNEKSLPALLVAWVTKGVAVIEGLVAQRRPFVKLWEEEIERAAGIARFDPATALRLHAVGIIDEAQTIDELRTSGLSETRAKALIEGVRQLPSTSQVLTLFAANWIDNATASSMLRALAWEGSDIDLLLNSSYQRLGASTLVELVRRGELSRQEAQAELERQGYRQADSDKWLQLVQVQLGLQDHIQRFDRAAVQAGPSAFASLNSAPPSGLTASAAMLGIRDGDAAILWANHWRLLTPELACQAYFRSYITREMLAEALAAASIPPELHDNYIDLQRPMLPTRSITTLIAQGIIDQGDGMEILRKRGFSDVDANRLVQLELRGHATPQAAQADHLHGLTQSTVLALYDAGTVSGDETRTLLAELGWAPEAIEATVAVHDVRAAHAERMAAVDLTVARAKAGLVDYDSAAAELQGQSLTSAELNKALSRLTTNVAAHTKLPSDSQMLAMWKAGLLDEAATLEALQLVGYSTAWAKMLIDLEAQRGTKQPQP